MSKLLSKQLYDDTEKPGQLFDKPTHEIIFDRYHFSAELIKNKRVLEVGPGAGFGLSYLSAISKSYNAIEFSEENIESLKSQDTGNAEISQGDAHNIPFSDGSFDIILALAMIYYLALEDFLMEANRSLSDSGTLFFCTSNKNVPGFCEAPYTTCYYSIPDLNKELEAAGFDAEFYGAFPTNNSNLTLKLFIAFGKNILKSFFWLTDMGRKAWINIRLKSLGELIPLPNKITKDSYKSVERVKLDNCKINYEYKVIYVVARKMAK